MTIPWNVIAPLLALQLLLMAAALVDLVRREPERVRGPRWVWALVIVLVSTIGPVAYLVAGRKD